MKKTVFITLACMSLALHAKEHQTVFVSQEMDISKREPDKISVLAGNLLCQPVKTGYGYAAVGEGKQVYGFTQEGKLLWQKSLFFRPKPFMGIGMQDMITLVSEKSVLCLMNSTGLILWERKCDFDIIDEPIQGIDGRIFVRGKNELACYGINGNPKWKTETGSQLSDVKPALLNNGYTVVFLEEVIQGKHHASIINQYGSVAAEVSFDERVNQAVTCSDGVLLSFSNADICLLASQNGRTIVKWTIESSKEGLGYSPRILNDKNDGTVQIISGSPRKITSIESATGKIKGTYATSCLTSEIYEGNTEQGLVLMNPRHAWCYGEDGCIIWHAKLDPSKKWNHVYPTDSGYLCFAMDNWALDAYQMKLNLNPRHAKARTPCREYYFRFDETKTSAYVRERLISDETEEKIRKCFHEGAEQSVSKPLHELLRMEMNQLYADWTTKSDMMNKSYFQKDAEYSSLVIDLVAESGTAFEQKKIAALAVSCKDPLMTYHLVRAMGKIAYDPNEEFIKALEMVIKQKCGKKTKMLSYAVIDATYEICRFMGRPMFFKKGQEIFSYTMYPQFDSETKEYSRKKLEKLMKLKL